MGVIGLAGTAAKIVRPLADAVRSAEALAEDGGQIDVLPGDPEATARVKELLDAPSASGPDEDALAVLPVRGDTDLSQGAPALVARRSSGGGALALVVGDPDERRDMERRLLRGHRLEMSNIAHVPTLEGPEGAEAAVSAILPFLGDEAVAAGRRNPGLRDAVGKDLVRRAARQSAAVGALPMAGVDMPVITLIQVRLVAQLAALYGRPLGPERAIEALAVFGAGFAWRAVGRSAVGFIPVAGWAARGAVAYAATRALGEAALARLQAGHDLIEGVPIDKARPLFDRVAGRLGR